MIEDERLARLELDVDARLVDLWREAANVKKWTLETASQFMRSAYARGYADALEEPVPGELYRAHGYATPKRRRSK